MKNKTRIEWAEIPGQQDYLVSNEGQIRSLKGSGVNILSPMKSKSGHLYVFLYDGHGNSTKTYIHRAVLIAFAGQPRPGQESRHLDGNSENNHLGNLLWGTRQENVDDRRQHGRMPVPHESRFTKLVPRDIPSIRKLARQGMSSRRIGRQFGTSHTTIQKIVRGERWKGY
jgi:hypothetical protein